MYKINKYKYGFQKYETIRSFGDKIYAGKISIGDAEINLTNLSESIIKFSNKSKPETKEAKDKKRNTFDSVNTLYEGGD